jgi:hypothetical protein
MTSAINPNNIDGTYPVAGQDNNSQGFRDNFTNIKTNFGFARNEITDLQNNVVLKSALTGTQLNNNMNGSILSNAKLQNMQETRVSLGSTQGAIILNYAAGSYYTVTTTDSITLAFTNFPAPSTISVARMRLQITVSSTAHTLTLPSSVTRGVTGIQGLSAGVITFGSTGVFEFEFETSDGGGTVTIFDLNRPLVAGYTNAMTVGSTLTVTSTLTGSSILALPSSEDLNNAASANLNVTSSYVITSGSPGTANLAPGIAGQIKVFCFRSDGGGDMVITVANAGWKTIGTGTITLADIGDACTLMYINDRWFCIGNNGCVFG